MVEKNGKREMNAEAKKFAEKWGTIPIGDGLHQVVRLSKYDVPEIYGGEWNRRSKILRQGYELRPRYWCCGCLYFVPEGSHTGTSCFACQVSNAKHYPCGVINDEQLKKLKGKGRRDARKNGNEDIVESILNERNESRMSDVRKETFELEGG